MNDTFLGHCNEYMIIALGEAEDKTALTYAVCPVCHLAVLVHIGNWEDPKLALETSIN